MLGSYPPRAGNDGSDAYLDAIENALIDHPREVAIDCADPVRGVVKQCKFVPTVADIHAWCEPFTAVMRDVVRRDDERLQAASEAAQLQHIKLDRKGRPALEDRPSLEALKAKHGPNWGLKGIDPVLAAKGEEPGCDREAITARRAARESEANQRAMLAEYAAKGFEPVLDGGGRVRSYQIVASMNPGLLVPVGQSQAQEA